ncbi:MAG TPA: GAF domain-containing protein, partial [Acidovorax sp.]|nr:GAF domain-containing protein [Acidovorax sp.]
MDSVTALAPSAAARYQGTARSPDDPARGQAAAANAQQPPTPATTVTLSRRAQELAARGVASTAVLPLLVAHEVVGVIALFADEAGFFDDDEMHLLTDLAGDIGFAMDHLDKEERLNYLAYYDDITGLPNRTLFLERSG